MLETLKHGDNSFVTLTYEQVPAGGSLVPKDLQDWLKRFRKSIEPVRIRYFAVGEYGDQTWRPHYHVALFGYPSCLRGQSNWRRDRSGDGWSCCAVCDRVRETWGLGTIHSGDLNINSASYVAGYVTKKMTAKDDPRLEGRYPEFSRMSLRPGIGAAAMEEVATTLQNLNLVDAASDVPSALRHGNRLMPLGRYLRRRLRLAVGKEASAPQEINKEMLLLLYRARFDAESPSFKAQVVKNGQQKALNAVSRHNLKRKKSL